MTEKPDPDMDVGYKGIAGAPCQFTGVNYMRKLYFKAEHRDKKKADTLSDARLFYCLLTQQSQQH